MCVLREAWIEQVPQPEFTADESQGDLRRLGERLVATREGPDLVAAGLSGITEGGEGGEGVEEDLAELWRCEIQPERSNE